MFTTEVSVIPMPLLHLLHPPDPLRGWGRGREKGGVSLTHAFLANECKQVHRAQPQYTCTYLPLSVICALSHVADYASVADLSMQRTCSSDDLYITYVRTYVGGTALPASTTVNGSKIIQYHSAKIRAILHKSSVLYKPVVSEDLAVSSISGVDSTHVQPPLRRGHQNTMSSVDSEEKNRTTHYIASMCRVS